MTDTVRRSALGRIGGTAARHPLLFLAGWVAVLAVVFATAILGLGGQSLFGRLATGAPSVHEESYHGQQLLTSGTKSTTYSLLVHGVDVDSPQLAAIASDLGTKAAALPRSRYLD